MSLLRLVFWIGLIVLLLPTDAQQQARFSNFANSAVTRVTTFCDRNGRTCAAGSDVWATFLRKAEFGMRLVGDLLGAGGRQQAEPRLGAPGTPPGTGTPYDKRPVARRGTLQPPDLYQPPWRGPGRPSG